MLQQTAPFAMARGMQRADMHMSLGNRNARQRASAARLQEYVGKRRKAKAVAAARLKIFKVFSLAMQHLRHERVRRVHDEWKQRESALAASAAAAAAAEHDRLLHLRQVRAAQVRTYLRSLLWRAWSTIPQCSTQGMNCSPRS